VRLPFEYVKQHRINETMAVDIFIGENGKIIVKPMKVEGVENATR
jgi:antitoxin component of MazEF toxin-antitoxin module